MAIILNDNIKVNAGKPVESKYLNNLIPYSGITQVNNTIPIAERYVGLTVNIDNEEYWYATGVTNSDLKLKQSTEITITGASNGISIQNGNVILGGNLTGNTTIFGDGNQLNLGTGVRRLSSFNISSSGTSIIETTGGFELENSGSGEISIDAKNNTELILKSQSGTTTGDDFTGAIGINLDYNNDIFTIIDNRPTPKGIVYGSDYSQNYVDLSLITKKDLDSVASGIKPKDSVFVATTLNIDLTGGTFGGTIDSITINNNDRVLVKNQTNPVYNGIYIYSGGSNTFIRSSDMNSSGNTSQGNLTVVITGNTNGNSAWYIISDDPIIVDVDPINWALFLKPTDVIEGTGITISNISSSKKISVELAPNGGLNFDSTSDSGRLRINPSIAGLGLTYNTGIINNNISSITGASGTEILVKINTGGTNSLFVDSDDINNVINPILNANNGLTLVNQRVRLGGTLTGNTTIDGNDFHNLNLIDLNAFNLSFDGGGTITNNSLSSPNGILYGADYSSGYEELSLVHAGYVTGLTSQIDLNINYISGITDNIISDVDNLANLSGITINSLTGGTTVGIGNGVIFSGITNNEFVLRNLRASGDTIIETVGNDVIIYGSPSKTSERIEKSITQNSHGFNVGDVIGYSGGTYVKGIAKTDFDGEILGIVSESGSTNDFTLVFAGYVSGLTSLGLSPSTTYFASDSVAGSLTPIEPSSSGSTIKPMLTTTTSDEGIVFQYLPVALFSGYTTGAGSSSGVTTGLNLGGAEEIFKDVSGNTMLFRTIQGTGGTSVFQQGDIIFISGGSSGSSSGTSWGSITGTLSNQTDLQNEFDEKVNITGSNILGSNNWSIAKINGGSLDILHTGSGVDNINITTAGSNNGNIVIQKGGAIGNVNIERTANDVGDITLRNFNNDANSNIIIGTANGTGAKYFENYSSGFTNRSLVDKEYVVSIVSGSTGITNATNGLSIQSGNVVLGGLLTGNTEIGFGGFGFSLGCNTLSAYATTAFGSNNCATAVFANAIGNANCATGSFSHVRGSSSKAIASFSTAIGNGACAYGDNSFAIGTSSIASGNTSFALRGCAGGNSSVAMGINTCAGGNYSFALGLSTSATGCTSFAIGNSNVAGGNYSFVGGSVSRALGNCSFSFGGASCAFGATSIAMGSSSCTFSDCSIAIGNSAIILENSSGSVVIGGSNNIISGSTNTAIIGGNNINVSGSSYDNYVVVPNLTIFDNPSGGTSSDDILVWNSSDKKVKSIGNDSFWKTDANFSVSEINPYQEIALQGHTEFLHTGKLLSLQSNNTQINMYDGGFGVPVGTNTFWGSCRTALFAGGNCTTTAVHILNLPSSGNTTFSSTMGLPIRYGGDYITGMTNPNDIVSKKYVDVEISGVTNDLSNVSIVEVTGSTIIDNTYNNKVIEATGTTGFTLTISSGVTAGFNTTVVNFSDFTISFDSTDTILSKNSLTDLASKYGAVSIYKNNNNQLMLFGDLS